MSKEILIINIKIENDKHICCDSENAILCPLWNKEKNICQYCLNTQTNNCPLKPLPQKKDAFEEHMKVESNERYISETLINQIRGYNYCLDEILNENNVYEIEIKDSKYQDQIDDVLGKDIVDKFFKGDE